MVLQGAGCGEAGLGGAGRDGEVLFATIKKSKKNLLHRERNLNKKVTFYTKKKHNLEKIHLKN